MLTNIFLIYIYNYFSPVIIIITEALEKVFLMLLILVLVHLQELLAVNTAQLIIPALKTSQNIQKLNQELIMSPV